MAAEPIISDPDFFPADTNDRRGILERSLGEARARWYQFELERKSRELTLSQAKAGKLRATKHKSSAAAELMPQIDVRLAQIAGDQQQAENEIKVYSDELKKLPKDTE